MANVGWHDDRSLVATLYGTSALFEGDLTIKEWEYILMNIICFRHKQREMCKTVRNTDVSHTIVNNVTVAVIPHTSPFWIALLFQCGFIASSITPQHTCYMLHWRYRATTKYRCRITTTLLKQTIDLFIFRFKWATVSLFFPVEFS